MGQQITGDVLDRIEDVLSLEPFPWVEPGNCWRLARGWLDPAAVWALAAHAAAFEVYRDARPGLRLLPDADDCFSMSISIARDLLSTIEASLESVEKGCLLVGENSGILRDFCAEIAPKARALHAHIVCDRPRRPRAPNALCPRSLASAMWHLGLAATLCLRDVCGDAAALLLLLSDYAVLPLKFGLASRRHTAAASMPPLPLAVISSTLLGFGQAVGALDSMKFKVRKARRGPFCLVFGQEARPLRPDSLVSLRVRDNHILLSVGDELQLEFPCSRDVLYYLQVHGSLPVAAEFSFGEVACSLNNLPASESTKTAVAVWFLSCMAAGVKGEPVKQRLLSRALAAAAASHDCPGWLLEAVKRLPFRAARCIAELRDPSTSGHRLARLVCGAASNRTAPWYAAAALQHPNLPDSARLALLASGLRPRRHPHLMSAVTRGEFRPSRELLEAWDADVQQDLPF